MLTRDETQKVIAEVIRLARKNLMRESYCSVCGQIGCGHDGLDRSEA